MAKIQETANWLTYDWEVEEQPARYCVDLALADLAPDSGREILLYLCCASRDPKSMSLTPGEDRKAQKLLDKCLKTLDCAYAGYIETDAQRQYYFYVDSEEKLDGVNAMLEKEKKLLVDAGIQKEPKWQTYFKLLYPDAAKYQTVKNREVIALLKKRGDAITPTRRVNLHVAFRSEILRLTFEEEARLAGFAIGHAEFHPEQENAHGVTLHTVSGLKTREIDKLTTRTIRLAEKFHGELMHWDCQFVPGGRSFR